VPLRLLQDERIKDSSTIAVFVALAAFIDNSTARCFPSLRTIGKRARCSADAAARHIELLIKLGYVERKSGKLSGRSNEYHLIDAWGRVGGGPAPVQEGCRMDAAGGTAPVPDKLDSLNQNQKQRETQALSYTAASTESAPPLSSLLDRMKTETQLRGSPPSFMGKDWVAGIFELHRGGVGEGEIFEAFRECLEQAPERVTFFPKDFLKWRKVSRERAIKQRHQRQDSGVKSKQEGERRAQREQILREQESEEGRRMVEQATASLPWKRIGGGVR
jgi:hypothetical protein